MARKKLNSINDLILFTIYSSAEKGELGFEDLSSKCFKNFPRIFCLKNYPKLLDTRKLDRPLRTLRKKGLIKGNPTSRFSLTAKGKKIAKELNWILRQKKLF